MKTQTEEVVCHFHDIPVIATINPEKTKFPGVGGTIGLNNRPVIYISQENFKQMSVANKEGLLWLGLVETHIKKLSGEDNSALAEKIWIRIIGKETMSNVIEQAMTINVSKKIAAATAAFTISMMKQITSQNRKLH